MASRYAEIWGAVSDHFELYPGKPASVIYPGETFDAPDPLEPYVILDDLRYDPTRVYWRGDNWRTGSLMIMAMIPNGWTYEQKIQYAGSIADYFAEDTTMSFGGVSLKVSRQPSISQAGYRDGSHFRLPIRVDWEGFVG